MPAIPDEEVRAASLATIQRLRESHRGRIPRSALMEGVRIRGERVPIWNPQQGIFKPAIFGRDGAALTIHTSIGSPYDDVHDPDAGSISYKYRGSDPAHHDNVALRRAMVRQLPLIYLVAVDPGYYDAIAPVYIARDTPMALEFTLHADQAGAPREDGDGTLSVLRREYVTRAVLQRLHQHEFRRVVLSAYGHRCCVCRLRHLELLDAAHILEDKHPKGEPAVTNGLGMCKIHHSAYDACILGIDADAKVHVRSDILHERDGPMLKHGLQEMAGTRLVLPRRDDLKPNRDFLAERFDRFRAA